MTQQAFPPVEGMLKRKGIEVEALNLEHESNLDELMKATPTLENREALLKNFKTQQFSASCVR